MKRLGRFKELVPGYVTPRQAAAALGVALRTVQRWQEQKRIAVATVHVPVTAIPVSELHRLQGVTFNHTTGRTRALEPDPLVDLAAWRAWQARRRGWEKRKAALAVKRAETEQTG